MSEYFIFSCVLQCWAHTVGRSLWLLARRGKGMQPLEKDPPPRRALGRKANRSNSPAEMQDVANVRRRAADHFHDTRHHSTAAAPFRDRPASHWAVSLQRRVQSEDFLHSVAFRLHQRAEIHNVRIGTKVIWDQRGPPPSLTHPLQPPLEPPPPPPSTPSSAGQPSTSTIRAADWGVLVGSLGLHGLFLVCQLVMLRRASLERSLAFAARRQVWVSAACTLVSLGALDTFAACRSGPLGDDVRRLMPDSVSRIAVPMVTLFSAVLTACSFACYKSARCALRGTSPSKPDPKQSYDMNVAACASHPRPRVPDQYKVGVDMYNTSQSYSVGARADAVAGLHGDRDRPAPYPPLPVGRLPPGESERRRLLGASPRSPRSPVGASPSPQALRPYDRNLISAYL